MRTWKNTRTVVALALALALTLALAQLAWRCGMAETKVFQPKMLDGMKEVTISEDSRKLDAEVRAFLRDRYSIESAHYYRVPAEIPWLAVAKSVQNQMAEKSIQRTMFAWYEPGIDFVEVYPEGKNSAAFAVAMRRGTNPDAVKLVGFYVLRAHAAVH